MSKVSVLMSIYNESEYQIELAVKSILSQSFTDYELIIINDAPQNKKLKEFLKRIKNLSSKIKVYTNKENIGLALSMNYAAEISSGKYIARMDADDMSFSERLAKEVKVLDSGKFDFVFTNYNLIDEDGNLIKEKASEYYSPEIIKKKICERNIIHHPTVMMTREIFKKAGEYRNFPCAQDYDLWLRLLTVNCRFYMIDEVLFQYRIRNMSITSRKRIQQKLTIDYSRNLLLERLQTGTDSYSYKEYEKYIDSTKLKYKNIEKQMDDSLKKLNKAKELKKRKKYISMFFYRINVFLSSPFYRDSYINQKIIVKKIKNIF